MANLLILDKITEEWIELPRAFYTIGSEEVANEIVMASGKVVKDVKGARKSISATFSYVPAETVAKLCDSLRLGGFHQVQYEDLNGDVQVESFSITHPAMTVFCFRDGKAVWAELTIDMTGQEVF